MECNRIVKHTENAEISLLPLHRTLSLQLGFDNIQWTRSNASYETTSGTSFKNDNEKCRQQPLEKKKEGKYQ